MIEIYAKPAIFQQMMDLVNKNTTEVGWYGVCERDGDDVEIVAVGSRAHTYIKHG